MAAPSMLDQLRDIHPPQSVAWWPLAPGWWIVIILVFLLTVIAWWWRKKHQKQQWQRDALRQLQQELAQLEGDYHTSNDGNAACSALSSLMRRVALHAFPDDAIAGLHGEAWLRYLDDKELIGERFAHAACGEMLLHAPYSATNVDPEPLIERCQQWMEAALQRPASDNGKQDS